jgi:hypothetical protein
MGYLVFARPGHLDLSADLAAFSAKAPSFKARLTKAVCAKVDARRISGARLK